MKLHDPNNRLAKTIHGAEFVVDFTIEGAREASQNCEKCCGQGFAPIFSPRYQGDTIGFEIDPRIGKRQVLMKSNGYCLCPLGRKIAILHQQSSKDVFLRTPDIHDVIAGKYPNWQSEDPTRHQFEPMNEAELPEAFKRLLAETRPRIYHEPREEPRDEINRMFDDEAI